MQGPPLSPSLPPGIIRRSSSNRRGTSVSSRSSAIYDESPYPADMPPGPERRHSNMSLASLSKEEIKEREALINKFEAEEELIMNRLSRRMDELKASTAMLSNTMEAESENIVNRLHRQLRIVEAQLAAAQASSASQPQSPVAPSAPSLNAVGLQTFLTGSDPVMMGNVVQQLHEDKAMMQRQMDALSSDNDALRQELIDLRQRLNIPVDDLIGLGSRSSRSGGNTYNRNPVSGHTNNVHASGNITQPIPFMRRPAALNNRSMSPPHHASTSHTTSSSSSQTDSTDPIGPFLPGTGEPSSHATNLTSPSDSPYAFSPQSLPPVPHNTYTSPPAMASMTYSPIGRQVAVGTGGFPLPYPSVPPPSLANSLASTSALGSPNTSPINSRRPSMGRIAERGSFAGGREAFVADNKRGPVEEEVIEE